MVKIESSGYSCADAIECLCYVAVLNDNPVNKEEIAADIRADDAYDPEMNIVIAAKRAGLTAKF